MIKLKLQVSRLGVELKRYSKTLDSNMKEQLRQAARAWVTEVAKNVPVWTGTSRGTLQPLAAKIRATPVTADHIVVRKNRGPSVGRASSEYSFDYTDKTWTFTFKQELPYFITNENYDVSAYIRLRHKTPWHAIKAGDAAFTDYMNKHLLERVPNLHEFISIKESTIS